MDQFVQQLLNGVTAGSVYVLLALGLTLVFGLLGVLNFAQGQLMVLGAFFTYSMTVAGIPYFLAVVVAVVVVTVVAILLERIVFRPVQGPLPLDEINGLIVSIGLIGIVQNLVLIFYGVDERRIPAPFPGSIEVLGVSLIWQPIFLSIVCLIVVAAMLLFLGRGRWGWAMRATLQNRDAAALMGIPTQGIIVLSFALGGALAAVAGALVGTISSVDPSMSDTALMKGFVTLIVGGPGNALGAVLAGYIIGIAEALGGGYISLPFKDAFGWVILVLVLLFRPRGLLPERLVQRTG